ncbi:hypothetical protein BXZ70DRAFT_1007257 [Cristinia sonorae]|uniref:Uncharacterized protein n=1 Tax=Cristinia sonorae TaxID=1940300 RepID=A0A8K0UQ06_9AGAR|nr:hypothetical protein BXZ70DRAFT_1007257 [Cristinia sonorae]
MHVVDVRAETDPALLTPSVCRVRFDSACVLIPEPAAPSRMPRILSKSYSLPLWKKKSPASTPSSPVVADASEQPPSPVEDGRARFRFSRSPSKTSRARSTSRDTEALVPCIVDHEHPHRRHRRPSLPITPKSDVVTIPLRECCLKCYPVAEESWEEGSSWQEKFTKGARRRRNSSADDIRPTRRRVSEDLPGFETIINVDEVDIRRRSKDSDSPTTSAIDIPAKTDTCILGRKLVVATSTTLAIPKPSVIEEDEDQLFPLPSPRRTPNGSPVPSPAATPSSSSTNLAKTVLGQKGSPNAKPIGRSVSPRPIATGRESPNLLATASPLRPLELHRRADITPPRARELSETSTLSSSDDVPELTSSPSSFTFADSPDLSLLGSPQTPSLATPSVTHSHPIAIRQEKEKRPTANAYDTSPIISTAGTSPQLRRGNSLPAGSGLSISPQSWRKLHLPNAGSILKAGADVLKGVSSMSGGVAV